MTSVKSSINNAYLGFLMLELLDDLKWQFVVSDSTHLQYMQTGIPEYYINRVVSSPRYLFQCSSDFGKWS